MGDDERMIRIKRVYVPAEASDGARFLVDRLWPRGVRKEALALRAWLKDAAPSTPLRQWYHSHLEEWPAFRRRYLTELEADPEAWKPLLEEARQGTVTLLYSSRDSERNHALVLKNLLDQRLGEERDAK